MPDGPLRYIIIVILLVLSFFFSFSETAFASYNKIRMRVKADNGNKVAKTICKLDDHKEKTIITILIANNVVNIFLSAIMTISFIEAIVDENLASLLATILTTVIVYIFAESFPKSIARANADRVIYFAGYLVNIFTILLTPISIIFQGMTFVFTKIFKIKEEHALTEDDFSNIIESIEEQGIIEEGESDIIQSAIDFGDTIINEVLTPREKMFALDYGTLDHEVLKEAISKRQYSRIPVYKGTIDNIIGILHVRTYLKKYMANKNVSIRRALNRVYFASSKDSIDIIIEGFKKNKTHIAIVRNAQNQTIGMVTMEDILEELVGSIAEHQSHPPLDKGGKK